MLDRIISNPNSKLNRVISHNGVQKTLKTLTNPKHFAPVLALESTVVIGRSVQSYKRGGLIELKERIFEETATSAIWLFGVKVLCDAFDKVAKKFNLDTAVDMVPDKLARKPGFLATKSIGPINKMTKGLGDKYTKNLATLKLGKILLSSAIAIGLVGSVIPRINQARTKKLLAENKKKNEDKNLKNNPTQINKSNNTVAKGFGAQQNKQPANSNSNSTNNMNQFLNSTKKSTPAFAGGAALNTVKYVGYNIENNDLFKMLTVDGGVTGGRALHARNKDEMIEILVRDLGSVPFYLFTAPLVSKGLAKHFNNKLNINTSLDFEVIKHTNDKILNSVEENKNNISLKDLKNKILGQNIGKEKIKEIKSEFESNNISFDKLKTAVTGKLPHNNNDTLKTNFNSFAELNKKSLICDDLIEVANETKSKKLMDFAKSLYKDTFSGKNVDIKKKIKESNLDNGIAQKVIDVIKKPENNKQFITKQQVKHVVNGGLINTPEFLGEAYGKVTQITDPTKFTPPKDLKKIHSDIVDYTKKMFTDLENRSTKNVVNKENVQSSLARMKNAGLLMKTAYFAAGFGVSAFFLSFVIPKLQCYITKARTGSNKFPGAMEE